MTNLDSILKSRDITLPTKVRLVRAMVFPVVMYGCESWTVKKAQELMLLNCGVGEGSWESLGLQGDPNSPFWRSVLGVLWKEDAKAETTVLWPAHAKSWVTGKDSDAERDLGQEEKGMAEDEMAGWHHGLDEHEFEWIPGVGDGQGGLACCDSWQRVAKSRTGLSDWFDLIWLLKCGLCKWGAFFGICNHFTCTHTPTFPNTSGTY